VHAGRGGEGGLSPRRLIDGGGGGQRRRSLMGGEEMAPVNVGVLGGCKG
jgi:hypothetical protein